MITYLYTLDYDDSSAHDASATGGDISEGKGELSLEGSTSQLFTSLLLNVRVYAIAEKYNIQGLKNVAQLKFTAQLRRTCVEKQLLSVIEEVYTTTTAKDRGLRDPLVDVIYGDIQYWTTQEDFLDSSDRCRDFHSDILRYIVKKDLEKLEAAISAVQDPGCCSICNETLLLRKWKSRRNNVNFEKYCARCGVDTLSPVGS
jgi:hypothetical protein